MSARQIMSADDMRRALVRIGHEIVEKHGGAEGLALVGIEHRGPTLAARIAAAI
jgi:pyrimidine operon attenuation protein/uracil phosphoribosyltransferase